MAGFKEIKRMVFQDLGGWSAQKCKFQTFADNGKVINTSGWDIFDSSGRNIGKYEVETGELMVDGRERFKHVGMTVKSSVQYLWLLNEQRKIGADKDMIKLIENGLEQLKLTGTLESEDMLYEILKTSGFLIKKTKKK